MDLIYKGIFNSEDGGWFLSNISCLAPYTSVPNRRKKKGIHLYECAIYLRKYQMNLRQSI
jgi:hypothetical protein